MTGDTGRTTCPQCATLAAENERLRQTVAQLRTIERLYQELEQVNHDMVYGGYVHPSYWEDGREKRRQWAQAPLDGDGRAECVAAAKEAM